jgi:hypothetical protein
MSMMKTAERGRQCSPKPNPTPVQEPKMPNDDTDLGIDSVIKLNPLPPNWPSMSKGQIAKARIPTEVEFDCALPQGLVNLWYSHTTSGGDALLRHCVVIYPPGDFIGQVLDLVTGRIVDTKPVYASGFHLHQALAQECNQW